MTTSEAPPNSRAHKRRCFQFSVRMLLLFVLLVSIGLSWYAVRVQQARKQKEAVEAIRGLGGIVRYDYEVTPDHGPRPRRPTWLRRLLGDDFLEDVRDVEFPRGQMITEAELTTIRGLTQLQWLCPDGTKVTDAGLVQIKGLKRLQHLSLNDTEVTDVGLERVMGLPELQRLYLSNSRITDIGLEHLGALNHLSILALNGTQITDAGLKHLKRSKHLESLLLDGTRVTDAGLEHLRGLRQLQWLSLADTNVTDAGLCPFSLCFRLSRRASGWP